MIRFIDREEEIKLLERDWKSSKNAFVVVFGRRRIGKTRLIEEFLRSKDGIKYTAEDTNKKIQINEIKNIFASYLNDDFLRKQEISDWSSFFSYLSNILPKNKRLYLWIDEFSYIIKNDPSCVSAIQKFIDGFLRRSKMFFIVSGSLFGLMSEKILSASSPLYGRRTRDILLRQIPPQHVQKFLRMRFEDSFKVMLTIGGIPEYLLVASKYKSYESFIKNEFFRHDGYFYREPYFLLSQEFKEIKTYFSILNAISYGNTRPTEIANFVGIKAREIYPYLDLLINYNFIKREGQFLGKRKRGIYLIEDVFFDFWFNFVYRNREIIESTFPFKPNKSQLNEFLGRRFEIFVRENFNLFFDSFPKVGHWWYKDKEIDIIALDDRTKKILFVECKWQSDVDPEKVLDGLFKTSKLVEWNNDIRKESYAIFAKSFSKKINNFEGNPVYCFDLKDIEKIFRRSHHFK